MEGSLNLVGVEGFIVVVTHNYTLNSLLQKWALASQAGPRVVLPRHF